MSLDTPWQVEQTWGSNQAVLKGVLEGIRPQTVVECGCGNFSTPILRAGAKMLLTVEHDNAWVQKVQRKFPPSGSHLYLTFGLSGIQNGTDPAVVSPVILGELDRFYEHAFLQFAPYSFVLIDTFRCARVPAARAMIPRTGLVMLHDVEPRSRDYYNYHALDPLFEGWHRYEHRPAGMINKVHIIPWTALYSREPLDLDSLQPAVIRESERLWGLKVGLEEIHG